MEAKLLLSLPFSFRFLNVLHGSMRLSFIIFAMLCWFFSPENTDRNVLGFPLPTLSEQYVCRVTSVFLMCFSLVLVCSYQFLSRAADSPRFFCGAKIPARNQSDNNTASFLFSDSCCSEGIIQYIHMHTCEMKVGGNLVLGGFQAVFLLCSV